MRILYICDNLATFIFNEIIELKQRGHEIRILAEGTSRIHKVINEPILLQHGLDKGFYRFSKLSARWEKYRAFIPLLLFDFVVHPRLTVKALRYLLTEYPHPKYGIVDYLDIRQFFNMRIDLIHSPFSIPSIIDKVTFLSNILGIPYTLSFKAHDIWQGNHLCLSKSKTKRIKGASRIFTIAEHNRSYLQSELNVERAIEIIHDAINVDFFQSVNPEQSRNSIITVSRLHPEKGLVHLIEACHILHQRKVDYICTIIGEGPEKAHYEKLIDEWQVPNIYFPGYLTYAQVKEELQSQAVFVLPSIIDSDGLGDVLPNGLKEAMAMQVPVITSNIRGVEELVVDEVSGILVPPGDAQAIAIAIERIFNRPDLGRKMGKEGRKKIEKDFNVKTEVGKIEKIFIEATS
ncbi:glycosyltransferase [Candidatus Nitrospira salsa]